MEKLVSNVNNPYLSEQSFVISFKICFSQNPMPINSCVSFLTQNIMFIEFFFTYKVD